MATLPGKELVTGATTLPLSSEDWLLVFVLGSEREVFEVHPRDDHLRGTRCPILGIKRIL
jgi:hypothetical protein